MIKTLAVILLIGATSVYYTDFRNESALFSIFLPILAVLSFIALALWIVTLLHRRGIRQTSKAELGSGMDFSHDGSGGGDGG